MTKATAVFMMFLFGGFPTAASSESLEIWGSTLCKDQFLEPNAEQLKGTMDLELKVVCVGTVAGLIALLESRVEVSAASMSLGDAIEAVRKEAEKFGREISIPDNLFFHEIMKDSIIPVVHRDNPVRTLDGAQLRDIYTGKIRNWSSVGGPDLPIQVVTGAPDSATRVIFQQRVMGNSPLASGVIEINSPRDEIDRVSQNVGAIGVVSMSALMQYAGNTKVIRTQEISRPLGLITLGPPSSRVEKLIEFLISEATKKKLVIKVFSP